MPPLGPPRLPPGTPCPPCPAEGRGAPAAPHGQGRAEPSQAVPGSRPRAGRGEERRRSALSRGEGARCERRRRHLAAEGRQRRPRRCPAVRREAASPGRERRYLVCPSARVRGNASHAPRPLGTRFPVDFLRIRRRCVSPPPTPQSFRCSVGISTKRVLPLRGVVFACLRTRGTERKKKI